MIAIRNIIKEMSDYAIGSVSLDFKRDDYAILTQPGSLLIVGERGIGKTYCMLQYLREQGTGIYMSADTTIIKSQNLFDIVYRIWKNTGELLFAIDEIHRYPGWTDHIKSLIDAIPEGKFIISGSSSLRLISGSVDLSRRIYQHKMYGLSFREYLAYKHHISMPSLTIGEIFGNSRKIITDTAHHFTDLMRDEYCKQGYYIFGIDQPRAQFSSKIQSLITQIIHEDLGVFDNFETATLDKISKLFYFLANTPPSDLNLSALSAKTHIARNTLDNILTYLEEMNIIHRIPKAGTLSDRIRKESKIFLSHANLYYSITRTPDIGTIREALFVHAIKKNQSIEITSPKQGDFLLGIAEKTITVEIGGVNKDTKQLPTGGYRILDTRVPQSDTIIPLRLFGLV